MLFLHPANQSDYPELIKLWEASVEATHDFLSKDDIIFYRKKILEEYFDLVDLYTAQNSRGRILGFLGLSSNKVEMLFIHPRYRRKSIGKFLMDMRSPKWV